MQGMKAIICAGITAAALLVGAVNSKADETPKIRFGGTGNYGPVLPVIAAQTLGLFDKAGVKAEFINFSGGSASMEGLAAGEVDLINFFPPGLALALARGVKAKVVSAGTLTPRGWQIMVKKGSPITDIKHLVGKKIGTSANGSTTDFFALWAAQKAGGTMIRVPVGGGGLIPSLISGNVDAIVAYPPLSYKVAFSGDGSTLIDLGTAMEPNLPDVWIASEKAIMTNPEGVRRGLVGLFGAIKYVKTRPDWSIKFIEEQTKIRPRSPRRSSRTPSWVSRTMASSRSSGWRRLCRSARWQV